MKRVGVLHGGHPHALDDKFIPPSQKLRIAEYNELVTSIPMDVERTLLTSDLTRRRDTGHDHE
jgi:hypothetical protein